MYNEIKGFMLIDKEQKQLKDDNNYRHDDFKTQFNKEYYDRFLAWKQNKNLSENTLDEYYLELLRAKSNYNEEEFKIDYPKVTVKELARKYKADVRTISAAARQLNLKKERIRNQTQKMRDKIDNLLPLIEKDCQFLRMADLRKKYKISYYSLNIILSKIRK